MQPEYERCIAYNDKQLNINWVVQEECLQLSEKDLNSISFLEVVVPF